MTLFLLIGIVLIFQSGMFFSAFSIDRAEGRHSLKPLMWSIATGILGVYNLIIVIGKAVENV